MDFRNVGLTKYALTFGLLPCLLSGIALQAALIRPLDDLKVIEVPISQNALTRIAVKDDRILNVFGSAGEYVLEADEEQGQIFIRPSGFGLSDFPSSASTSFKPISLTLTTESGHTQDLRLTPRDQPPEALILTKPEEDEAESLKGKTSPLTITQDEVETLLQACQEERIPLGYKIVPLEIKTLQGSLKGNPYRLVREIRGDSLREISNSLRGLTYEVKNTTNVLLVLSEAELAKQFEEGFRQERSSSAPLYAGKHHAETDHKVVAILMPKKTLNPGEGAFVYVVARSSH